MINFIKALFANFRANAEKDARIAQLESLARDMSDALVRCNDTLTVFYPEGSMAARWSMEHYNDVMGGRAA